MVTFMLVLTTITYNCLSMLYSFEKNQEIMIVFVSSNVLDCELEGRSVFMILGHCRMCKGRFTCKICSSGGVSRVWACLGVWGTVAFLLSKSQPQKI